MATGDAGPPSDPICDGDNGELLDMDIDNSEDDDEHVQSVQAVNSRVLQSSHSAQAFATLEQGQMQAPSSHPQNTCEPSMPSECAFESSKRKREESSLHGFNDGTEQKTTILAEVDYTPKRKRLIDEDAIPCVEVHYKNLSRESVRKLREVMQKWMLEHASTPHLELEGEEYVESGIHYFFASSELWVDRPSRPAKALEGGNGSPCLSTMSKAAFNKEYEDTSEVPLYNRGTDFVITPSKDRPAEGYIDMAVEAARCWNCGSYNHSLKECKFPRDKSAINDARAKNNAKRGGLNLGPQRYYDYGSENKFPDSRPGFLSPEVRTALGIRDLDPPPWLNRMRAIGYPPGYFEGGDDEPSGIVIVGEDGEEGGRFPGEDEFEAVTQPREEGVEGLEAGDIEGRKAVVIFPGVNGPIPEGADPGRWERTRDEGGGGSRREGSLQRMPSRRSGDSSPQCVQRDLWGRHVASVQGLRPLPTVGAWQKEADVAGAYYGAQGNRAYASSMREAYSYDMGIYPRSSPRCQQGGVGWGGLGVLSQNVQTHNRQQSQAMQHSQDHVQHQSFPSVDSHAAHYNGSGSFADDSLRSHSQSLEVPPGVEPEYDRVEEVGVGPENGSWSPVHEAAWSVAEAALSALKKNGGA